MGKSSKNKVDTIARKNACATMGMTSMTLLTSSTPLLVKYSQVSSSGLPLTPYTTLHQLIYGQTRIWD